MKSARLAVFLLAATVSLVPVAATAAGSGYHVLKSVTLGGDGGFDYLNLDPDSGHLYITRGTHLMVVDTDSSKVLADIGGLAGIHGTEFVGGKAYISEGGANKVTVIDTRTFAKLAEIPISGVNPDGILYDAATRHLFTFNGRSNDATVIDPATGTVAGTIALGGKPEAASSDEAGTLYVNIENTNELVAIDAKALKVKARYPLTGCESPSGQAMDVAHGRLFAVCDGGVMAVVDVTSGKVVTTVKIGNGPDAARFDAATGLVFASNGQSGTLSVVHEDSPDHYTVLDNVETAIGARTMELDTKSHRVFVVSAEFQPAAATTGNSRPRPVPVPGSFRLMVLGR